MCGAFERKENDFWELKNLIYAHDTAIRGRISFRFARIKIDFKVSIITHFMKLILISGCYENHCENRFSDSRRISSPEPLKMIKFTTEV